METGIKEQIIEKAKEFGACAVSIADVEAIKNSPSHVIYEKIGDYKTAGNKEGEVKPRKTKGSSSLFTVCQE